MDFLRSINWALCARHLLSMGFFMNLSLCVGISGHFSVWHLRMPIIKYEFMCAMCACGTCDSRQRSAININCSKGSTRNHTSDWNNILFFIAIAVQCLWFSSKYYYSSSTQSQFAFKWLKIKRRKKTANSNEMFGIAFMTTTTNSINIATQFEGYNLKRTTYSDRESQHFYLFVVS